MEVGTIQLKHLLHVVGYCVLCTLASSLPLDYKRIKDSIVLPCANFKSLWSFPLPYLTNSAKNSNSLSWQTLTKHLLCTQYIRVTVVSKTSPGFTLYSEMSWFTSRRNNLLLLPLLLETLLLALLIAGTPLSLTLQMQTSDSYNMRRKVKKIEHCWEAKSGTLVENTGWRWACWATWTEAGEEVIILAPAV